MALVIPPRGIVVIEGADAAGKTTLARYLVDHHGARYLHLGYHADIWRWQVAALRRAVDLADRHLVVLDRHWPSEIAYGTTFRGRSSFAVVGRCLDRVLLKHAAVYILCAPLNVKKQVERHAEARSAGRELFDRVEAVARLYRDLCRGNVAHPGDDYLSRYVRRGDFLARGDTVVYDLDRDGGDLAGFARTVLDALTRRRAPVHPTYLRAAYDDLGGYWPTARTLFVGEAPADAGPSWPAWPFVWHEGLSAATYLNRALHELDADETRLAFTNALHPTDTLGDLLPNLGARRVVTLGAVARERVKQLGHPVHADLPHPQWWRRFRYRDLDGYARLLQEALS